MKHHPHDGRGNHYIPLLIELTVDFIIMYLVMYTMINSFANFHFNVNNFYMTMMMVAPMAVVMLVAMRSMFPSKAKNRIIVGLAVIVFAAGFYGMRTQAAVGNKEFIKSMVPHHSGAILMCREAKLTDAELLSLCNQIVKGQQEEIDQMERILSRL